MGGDLHKAPQGKAPTFLVAALRDPYSGNLDRIQVVKGWLEANGETHEKVYDVVWSGVTFRGRISSGPRSRSASHSRRCRTWNGRTKNGTPSFLSCSSGRGRRTLSFEVRPECEGSGKRWGWALDAGSVVASRRQPPRV
jgi:hypothetical protein